MPSSNLLREINIAMVTVALPVVQLFCIVLAFLVSLWEHLMCHCLCIVHSSLIVLRYGKFEPVYHIY